MSTGIVSTPIANNSGLRFYDHALTGEIRDRVTKQLSLLPSEQLSLFEEIAIWREHNAQTVKSWIEAKNVKEQFETYVEQLRKTQKPVSEIRTAEEHYRTAIANYNYAADKMAESMKFQKELVSSAASNDAKTKETIAANTLMLLINGVINLVHEYWNQGDNESIQTLERFEKDLRQRILIQEVDNQALAIETEYYQMLESVPDICEDSNECHPLYSSLKYDAESEENDTAHKTNGHASYKQGGE
jgi:hypothetical protein